MPPQKPPPLSPRRLALIGTVVLVLLGADLARPADRQLSARVLRTAIHVYQHTLSHVMPSVGIQCRFTPTCSHYADAVIARHGALVGGWMTFRRLLRCGPWTPMGTSDPPR
jgi:putative membrane protein insertion efficiency factor